MSKPREAGHYHAKFTPDGQWHVVRFDDSIRFFYLGNCKYFDDAFCEVIRILPPDESNAAQQVALAIAEKDKEIARITEAFTDKCNTAEIWCKRARSKDEEIEKLKEEIFNTNRGHNA